MGHLIDQAFPEEESLGATYRIEADENDRPIIILSPMDDYVLKEYCYVNFINQVSSEVFNNDAIIIYVNLPDSERKLVFKSNSEIP